MCLRLLVSACVCVCEWFVLILFFLFFRLYCTSLAQFVPSTRFPTICVLGWRQRDRDGRSRTKITKTSFQREFELTARARARSRFKSPEHNDARPRRLRYRTLCVYRHSMPFSPLFVSLTPRIRHRSVVHWLSHAHRCRASINLCSLFG